MIKLFDGENTLLINSEQILEIRHVTGSYIKSIIHFKGIARCYKDPSESPMWLTNGTTWYNVHSKEEIEKMIYNEKYNNELEKLL